VQKAFDAPGILIAQLNGAPAGQSVFHIHFHVVPRHEGFDLRLHARDMADHAVLAQHAARVRAALE
jgi:histidine triad (HIT) family protein